MSRFLPYVSEQGVLIPADAREALGSDHLCFFVHAVVERLDLRRYTESYGSACGVLYHPSSMLKVWLYAYALGVTSSRRLEQRIRENLAFRFLAGGARPDSWALNAFRKRHGRAIDDSFTQVVEMARQMGLRQLGTVAIDATRIKAPASPDKIVKHKEVKQKKVNPLKPRALKRARRTHGTGRRSSLRARLQSGSRTEPWTSPDDTRCRDPRLKRMRERMRSEHGRSLYRRRKALVEPVFGVPKEQRNLRAFRTRSLPNVATEFALAAIAYNLTRLHKA